MKKIIVFVLFPCTIAFGKDPYPKNNAIDVWHYSFQLEVNDSSDRIEGLAEVTILFKQSISNFELDLTNLQGGKGMEVSQVLQDGKPVTFEHRNNRLKILLLFPSSPHDESVFQIKYGGIPQDGLIIGNNKYGDRGFFGDNWPDRGHQWLPVIDHPSDKSSVDFIIIAPTHYSVVANGVKVEETPIDKNRKLTHWHEAVELPVKVMTVGIARFAIQYVGNVDDISVESWVYPQNRVEGFGDYAVAVKVLDFYHHHIGPYPYKKLANVQSRTRWGGLENANTIFYTENSVTGNGLAESLIAHEEAHQWFGNAATESDWHHVWLSEGFATYFTNLYLEYAYGRDRMNNELKEQRTQVIEYFKINPNPVVDTTITDIGRVLSTNTYQKAGWVLHMLRQKVGDLAFWNGIRQYYKRYGKSNALTIDFQRTMEESSNMDLSDFFKQWLFTGGHPKIAGTWTYDAKVKAIKFTLNQVQAGNAYQFPIEIGIQSLADRMEIKTLILNKKMHTFIIPAAQTPLKLILDPNTRLLYEGEIKH